MSVSPAMSIVSGIYCTQTEQMMRCSCDRPNSQNGKMLVLHCSGNSDKRQRSYDCSYQSSLCYGCRHLLGKTCWQTERDEHLMEEEWDGRRGDACWEWINMIMNRADEVDILTSAANKINTVKVIKHSLFFYPSNLIHSVRCDF